MYSSHFWLLRSGDGGTDPCTGDRGPWPESDEARGETLSLLLAVALGRSLVSFRSLFLGLGLLAGASSAGDICDTAHRRLFLTMAQTERDFADQVLKKVSPLVSQPIHFSLERTVWVGGGEVISERDIQCRVCAFKPALSELLPSDDTACEDDVGSLGQSGASMIARHRQPDGPAAPALLPRCRPGLQKQDSRGTSNPTGCSQGCPARPRRSCLVAGWMVTQNHPFDDNLTLTGSSS